MKNENALTKRDHSIPMPPGDFLAAVAKLPKRDEVECRQRLQLAATSSFAMAVSMLYCVPVGRDKDTGRQKFTLGESVRFAEVAKDAFGMMWGDGNIVEDDEDSVSAKYYQFDMSRMNLETGYATVKCYGRKELAEKNALAKAKRDAILNLLKPYTAAIIDDIKKAIVAGLGEKTSEAFTTLAKEFGEKWNVSRKELEEVVSLEKTSQDKVVLLYGIRNYIETNGKKGFKDVFGRDLIEAPIGRDGGKSAKDTPQPGKADSQPPQGAQTAKQRFNTLQANATLLLGDSEVDALLKFAVKKTKVEITKWSEKEYDVAAGVLADALEVKQSEKSNG